MAKMSVCKVCSICNRELIKQLVHPTGRILTEAEKNELQRYETAYRQTLECFVCRKLCYRRLVEEDNDGTGLCKRCGGKDLNYRPRDIENYKYLKLVQYPELWSCSIHGHLHAPIYVRRTTE
jgi:hypothetical protein